MNNHGRGSEHAAGRSRKWQAHVKALAQSGLSRAEYCRRHSLSYHAM
ncbi:MAG: IS66 family insertion sequence element accessory protein TnpA, partial [Desulfopila sp.]